MKHLGLFLFSLCFTLYAGASGKCSSRVNLAALDWAREVIESDLETDNQIGSEPLSVEIKSPTLLDKSKNPAKVFERYSIIWKLKFKDKDWSYTGFYFYDDRCHRMKSAEVVAGKNAEKIKAGGNRN